MEQVLSISGRTGTLGRFNGKDADVPFFERSFWEGLTTLGAGIIDAGVNPPIQVKNQKEEIHILMPAWNIHSK